MQVSLYVVPYSKLFCYDIPAMTSLVPNIPCLSKYILDFGVNITCGD